MYIFEKPPVGYARPAAARVWARLGMHGETLMLAGVTALISATLMTLAYFAFPIADDFCYAVRVRALGFIPAQTDWYFGWSGRFTATALLSAIALMGDIVRVYSAVLVATQVVTFISLWVLVMALRNRFGFQRPLLTALTLYVVFLTGLPDIAQYLYWESGLAGYAVGNAATLLLLAIMVNCAPRGFSGRGVTGVLMFGAANLLVVAAMGSNEVTVLAVIALLTATTALAAHHDRRRAAPWAWLLLLAVVCGSFALAAPGNFVRAQSLASDGTLRPSRALAAGLFLPWFALRTLHWLGNPGIWASAMVVMLWGRERFHQLICPGGIFNTRWLWVPPLWLLTLAGLTAIGFAVNCYPLPERAESVVWLMFLVGWYPSFIILLEYLGNRRILPSSVPGWGPPHGARRVAVAVLALSLLGSTTVFEAFKDTFRGYRYWREMQARVALISEARAQGLTGLEVPSLSRPPRTLFATELTTDPRNFRNSCQAEYYGLRDLALGHR